MSKETAINKLKEARTKTAELCDLLEDAFHQSAGLYKRDELERIVGKTGDLLNELDSIIDKQKFEG